MVNTDTQPTSNHCHVDEDLIRLGPDVPHHRLLPRKRSPPDDFVFVEAQPIILYGDDFVSVERQPFTEPIWGKVVNK